jgi:hypothetical protein
MVRSDARAALGHPGRVLLDVALESSARGASGFTRLAVELSWPEIVSAVAPPMSYSLLFNEVITPER